MGYETIFSVIEGESVFNSFFDFSFLYVLLLLLLLLTSFLFFSHVFSHQTGWTALVAPLLDKIAVDRNRNAIQKNLSNVRKKLTKHTASKFTIFDEALWVANYVWVCSVTCNTSRTMNLRDNR